MLTDERSACGVAKYYVSQKTYCTKPLRGSRSDNLASVARCSTSLSFNLPTWKKTLHKPKRQRRPRRSPYRRSSGASRRAPSTARASGARAHRLSRACGLPLRDCPMGRRAPPDFARYAPTIPGSSKQATIRRARSRRWRRQCSHECRLCRGHASSELHWLRHRRRDPG